jgi:hypothetical protein
MLATAATYYIDFPAGSDANNGTATNAAWQHCPGDAKATGIPATTPLAAGDTVIFRGGVSYTNSITVKWSGTTGNPITYDGNSAETWGTGKAILDGMYLLTNGVPGYPNYGANFILLNRANVTIRNFQIQHTGGVPMNSYTNYSYPANVLPNVYGIGVWIVDSTNILVANSLIQEMGYWTNNFPVNTDKTGQNGMGIKLCSVVNVMVTNCAFHRMAYCIGINSGYPASGTVCSNIVISSCDFSHYINWMITISPSSPSVTLGNILITNNAFHDAWETTSAYWWGGGSNANNGGGFPHFDGIFMGLANLPNIVYTNIVVAANKFYWNNTNGGGTAWIFLSCMGGDVSILNNVCVNNYNSYGFVYVQDGPFATNNVTPINFKIYNNTVAGPNCGFYERWTSPANGGDPGRGTIRVKNNIFYIVNTNTFSVPINIQDTTNGPKELDYNLYYVKETYNQDVILSWYTNSTHLYAGLYDVKGIGYEQHGIEANPQFVDFSYGLGFNSSLNNLHLQTNSPAIGAGANLSAVFSTDKDGILRPASGAWDIGAYDPSVQGVQKLSPPTGLKIIGP